jgi:endo-1,4-beta-xylanase
VAPVSRSRLLRSALSSLGLSLGVLGGLGVATTGGAGAQAPPEPGPGGPAGVPLLPPDALGAFRLVGSAAGEARLERVAVEDGPEGRPAPVLRVRATGRPALPYHVQLSARTAAAVESGDVVLATFAVRATEGGAETGEARTAVIFEQASEPYSKSLQLTVDAGPAWRRVAMPFKAVARYGPGQAQINFQLGFGPQTVELADVALTGYGRAVSLQDLPMTRFTYPGREPEAPWRAAALERIETLRKADLTVRVAGPDGAPLPGATVAVRLRRHAFGFGTAVAAAALTAQDADGERYRETFGALFGKAVMENDLKWPSWEDAGQRDRTMRALDWLRDRGVPVRGHNLVWPAWRYLPRDLPSLRADPEALRRRLREHIADEAGALRGRLADWDVVNEPYLNHDLQDVLGQGALGEWLALARGADPGARLFLNEATVPGEGERQDALEGTARALLDAGAPLDGLGFQCHFGWSLPAPEALLGGLDRFARLGLVIQVTELDVDVVDEALQADYLRDVLIAAYSHPAVDAVMLWGFWEGRNWRPDAALFRRDWRPKPNARAWLDLVRGAWWTETEGQTDARGELKVRGHHGEYAVEVTRGGRPAPGATATLGPEGATLEVTLP